jgi:hypothetical protein
MLIQNDQALELEITYLLCTEGRISGRWPAVLIQNDQALELEITYLLCTEGRI